MRVASGIVRVEFGTPDGGPKRPIFDPVVRPNVLRRISHLLVRCVCATVWIQKIWCILASREGGLRNAHRAHND